MANSLIECLEDLLNTKTKEELLELWKSINLCDECSDSESCEVCHFPTVEDVLEWNTPKQEQSKDVDANKDTLKE